MLVGSVPLGAQCTPVEIQKLLASDGAEGDQVGKSVSVSGDVAVVGANGDGRYGSGSAYVWQYYAGSGTWVEQQKLTASDGTDYDHFGVLRVGERGRGGGGGGPSTTIRRVGVRLPLPRGDRDVGGGTEAHPLGWNGPYFGYSVSVSGDVAVVGAISDSEQGPFTGAAYVFRHDGDTWNQEQKLTASVGRDARLLRLFRVGERGRGSGGGERGHRLDSGSAYVYRYDPGSGTWDEEQKLTASDMAAFDEFGCSVSVSGGVAFVGAQQRRRPGERCRCGLRLSPRRRHLEPGAENHRLRRDGGRQLRLLRVAECGRGGGRGMEGRRPRQ